MSENGVDCMPKCPMSEGWADHIEDVRVWMETTRSIHDLQREIHADTKHLVTLHDVVKELRYMREALVAPATSKNFLPLAPALALFTFMSLALVILGGVAFVHQIPDLTSFSLKPNEIQIQTNKGEK